MPGDNPAEIKIACKPDHTAKSYKHQISTVEFHASTGSADDLNPELQEALIDSLANALEYALIRKPELYLRKR